MGGYGFCIRPETRHMPLRKMPGGYSSLCFKSAKPTLCCRKLGEVLVKTGALDRDMNVAILVALTEAMEKVGANPRHEKESISE